MKVGIVGSRRRKCEGEVRALVRSLPPDTIVVSGGAKGVDSWAEDEAKQCGLSVEIHRPASVGEGFHLFCRAATDRNRKIAESVDVLYAFVAPDRKGGTEQTIRFAQSRGTEVRVL